jgi:hypothetical protein
VPRSPTSTNTHWLIKWNYGEQQNISPTSTNTHWLYKWNYREQQKYLPYTYKHTLANQVELRWTAKISPLQVQTHTGYLSGTNGEQQKYPPYKYKHTLAI